MFSGRFLKDGAIILVQPIKQSTNLSLKLEKFPWNSESKMTLQKSFQSRSF